MPTPTGILKFISGISDPEFVQTPQVEGHGPQQDCTHSRPTGYKSRGYPETLSGSVIH